VSIKVGSKSNIFNKTAVHNITNNILTFFISQIVAVDDLTSECINHLAIHVKKSRLNKNKNRKNISSLIPRYVSHTVIVAHTAAILNLSIILILLLLFKLLLRISRKYTLFTCF
jgi:ABC-type polysaccharide transport system permease subunit